MSSDEYARERVTVTFEGQQVVVAGHRGAGKSTWIQHVADVLGSGVVFYDMNREHEHFDRYVPDHRRGDEMDAEADGVIGRLVVDNDPARRPGAVVLEEANRYVPNRGNIPESVGELVDLGRHYETAITDGVSVFYVTRRPAQLDADVMELADYLVVYRVRGKNDVKRLNDEAPGLGDAARELDDYHYLLVRPDRSWVRMAPVPEGDTTGSL